MSRYNRVGNSLLILSRDRGPVPVQIGSPGNLIYQQCQYTFYVSTKYQGKKEYSLSDEPGSRDSGIA